MNNNRQNTYQQPPIEHGMPPHMGAPRGYMQLGMPMRQQIKNGIVKLKDVFPKWLVQYSIAVYILALMVVSFMYSAYSLPWYYMLSGVIAVTVFFLYGSTVANNQTTIKKPSTRQFEKRLFLYAFIPRMILMILLYWIFQENYGDAFGIENGDAKFYHDLGEEFADALSANHFGETYRSINKMVDISDLGYSVYLGFIYWATNKSIIVARIIKCLISSITVLLIYRMAKRNFGDQTARTAAIFCALWPNFWYYCAVHLKETEMVFLGVLFVEQADQMLRSRQFTAWKIIPILLIAAAMFTMRTPLGIVALLALVFSVVMSSSRVVSWGKRIIVGGLAILLVGVIAGDQLEERARGLLEAQTSSQKEGINFYATRDNGNALAKYAGSAVFAPMIFTLPFPTMVRPFEGQEPQQLLNGGNFVKNVLSALTILAIVTLLMSGRWREHLLPLSFMVGYLAVLAMSSFAHSERFHQPAMPFEFMFAAYGLSTAVTKSKYKRWFMYWCGLMFIAALAWNWFKMAGRGLA